MFYCICTDTDVRLVGGTSHCTGRLEVKHQGDWRPAADLAVTSNWNLKSSSAVCKQLDCGSAVDTKWRSVSERQRVWWITSSCNGSEFSLRECATMQSAGSVEGLEVTCSGNNNLYCLIVCRYDLGGYGRK